MKKYRMTQLKTADEVNNLIQKIDESGLVWVEQSNEKAREQSNFSFATYALIDRCSRDREVRITARLDKTIMTYVFRLDEVKDKYEAKGAEAWLSMQSVYPIISLDQTDWKDQVDIQCEDGKYDKAAGAFLWTNPEYDGKEVEHVWIYDLNSAYGAVVADKIPDFRHNLGEGTVGADEVGFVDVMDHFALIEEGEWAEIRFKLIDSPYKRWVRNCFIAKEKWKEEWKKTGADDSYKTYMRYKQRLNYAIGFYQRRNPFFRSYVVEKCNKYIRNLVDANTIFCNTDSIHSSAPRPDLDIGTGLGQFKIEEEDVIARYKGANWQVAGQKPKWRGVMEARLKDKNGNWINLLTDDLPDTSPRYAVAKTNNTWRIVENVKTESRF